MAQTVNPPPILKRPQAFTKDPQVNEYVKQLETIIFQLWQRSGGGTDLVADAGNISNNGFSSQNQYLQTQIDGLPEFTIGTTGFTTDITFITTDKVIA
jgi:hypothetical protein